MTVLLLLLMAYHLTGEVAHEWLGAAMFLLFFLHNLLNHKWYAGLFHGKYPPYRILQTGVNLLLLLAMLGQMISGAILSRYVFDFLPISGHASFGRTLHLLGAYWGFCLMSLHLGLHWNLILGMARKAVKRAANQRSILFLRLAAALIALYGGIAFIRYDLLSYMLLESQFVFFDYSQSPAAFACDYLAIMGLWIFAAHYGGGLLRKLQQRKKGQQQKRLFLIFSYFHSGNTKKWRG